MRRVKKIAAEKLTPAANQFVKKLWRKHLFRQTMDIRRKITFYGNNQATEKKGLSEFVFYAKSSNIFHAICYIHHNMPAVYVYHIP